MSKTSLLTKLTLIQLPPRKLRLNTEFEKANLSQNEIEIWTNQWIQIFFKRTHMV